MGIIFRLQGKSNDGGGLIVDEVVKGSPTDRQVVRGYYLGEHGGPIMLASAPYLVHTCANATLSLSLFSSHLVVHSQC